MKTQIFISIVLVSILVGNVQGDLIFDSGQNIYDDSYGFNFEVWVTNEAILDVTGGEIGKLEATDSATANIYSTEIDWLWSGDNSTINIYGDNINWLAAYENSSVNLYAYDVIHHLTGGGDWGDKEWIEGVCYSNDTYFSFWLYNDNAFSHINVVPEPATILLFGFGGIGLKRSLG